MSDERDRREGLRSGKGEGWGGSAREGRGRERGGWFVGEFENDVPWRRRKGKNVWMRESLGEKAKRVDINRR